VRRTQIYLSEQEHEQLRVLAQRSGRTQSALIREAVDLFLHQQQAGARLAGLREGRGVWASRSDLPDWESLRRELDR
jgi:predicted DNA-binding protein